jgi:hypothetical protein
MLILSWTKPGEINNKKHKGQSNNHLTKMLKNQKINAKKNPAKDGILIFVELD